MIKQLHLGLSNLCNLECKHCFVKNKKLATINREKVIEFINVLESQGLTHIYYTYGEPLLCKDFFDFCSIINKMSIFQILLTNGTLITEDIAKKISTSGINRVMVSIDSADEKTHDNNRGVKGTYNSAIQAIKYLKNSNVNVGIATTVTEANKNNLIDIERLGKKLNVDDISFLILRTENKVKTEISSQYLSLFYKTVIFDKKYYFHDKRLLKYLDDMKKLEIVSDKQFEKHKSLNTCIINENLSLAPDGEIYKCNFVNSKSLANLNNDSIEVIIENINNKCKGCEFCE